mgnify:CR=1 FL=1
MKFKEYMTESVSSKEAQKNFQKAITARDASVEFVKGKSLPGIKTETAIKVFAPSVSKDTSFIAAVDEFSGLFQSG